MASIPGIITARNTFRTLPPFALLSALLMAGVLFLATPALAVAPVATTTTLAVSPATVAAGTPITFTATVASAGTPLTAGHVLFCNAAASFCQDSALLGDVWLTTSGTATLRRALPPGTTNVIAVFQATSTLAVAYSTSTSAPQSAVVTGTQTPVTTANTFPTLGASAAGIVSGDFNNDGYPDLAIADASGTLQIFLGSGSGAFTTGASISLFTTGGSGQAVSLATADFNGDGNLDLVVNGSYILLGKGDGTFTLGLTPPTAAGTIVQVADFNNDGHADIVVYSGGFTVLLGSGDGTFRPGPGSGSIGVGLFFAVADFNGDGIPDLAVTGGTALGVQILLGKGDGSFTAGATYDKAPGQDPAGITAADFNGDGKPDLAVSDTLNQTVTILTGTGDGTFTVGTPISAGMPAGSIAKLRQVAAADFNGDGKTDLAVVVGWEATGAPSLALLPGNGDGTFATPSTFTAAPPNSFYEQAAAVADFFATGRSSVALLTGLSPSYATVLEDTSTGLTPVKILPVITWATPAAITNPAPLSATQLNATASVPGTFVYNPPITTVLAAGSQTLAVTFTPTDTVTYSPAEAMVTLTVNPAPPVTYTLTPSTQSVNGSANVTLSLFSTSYAGTVSFATTVTSANGNPLNVPASAPSVILTSGGTGSTVLTITASAAAANHVPVAPWSSGTVVFGVVLLGAPFTLRRKRALAVLLTAAAILLAAFAISCGGINRSNNTTFARSYIVLVTPTGTGTVTNPAPVSITVTVQ